MRRALFAAVAITLLAAGAPGSAQAQGTPAPGEFQVPGTDTMLKLYGFVQLTATVDFAGRPVGYENSDWATILPQVPGDDTPAGKHVKPQTYFTARTSRFGIQTRTPSRIGEIGLKLEADFNGPNDFQSETYTNSTVFRLRQAYGTVGGLLVGQTWSTFLDLNASPETVDFNGPGTQALVRNPQIRYTLGLGKGLNLALALENARGPQFGTDARFQTLPDVHANLGYSGSWGTVSARTVIQTFNRARLNGAGNAYVDEDAETKVGVAFAVSGTYKLGKDTLLGQFVGGPGIGRYILNSSAIGNSGPGVTVDPDDGSIKLWTLYGVHAGYSHAWNPEFRSNLIGAYTWVIDAKPNGEESQNNVQKDFIQAFVNTFYSPARTVDIGLEYSYGKWRSFTNGTDRTEGTQHRITGAFHFNYY